MQYFVSYSFFTHPQFNATGNVENDLALVRLPVATSTPPAPLDLTGARPPPPLSAAISRETPAARAAGALTAVGEEALAIGYGLLSSYDSDLPAQPYVRACAIFPRCLGHFVKTCGVVAPRPPRRR